MYSASGPANYRVRMHGRPPNSRGVVSEPALHTWSPSTWVRSLVRRGFESMGLRSGTDGTGRGGPRQIALLEPFLRKYDVFDRFCYRAGPGSPTFAPSMVDIDGLYASADILLNVTGAQELREEHFSVPLRAYIESDPFCSQVKYQSGEIFTREQLGAHTHHFTFGENIGQLDCLIPETGHRWHPTRQPVDLSIWSTLEETLGGTGRSLPLGRTRGKTLIGMANAGTGQRIGSS